MKKKKSMNDVETLRKHGCKVRIKHMRPIALNVATGKYQMVQYSRKTKGVFPPFHHGGYTEVDLTLPDGGKTYSAKAECSKNDRFNYRLGVRIALSRIMKQIDNEVDNFHIALCNR